MKTPARLLCLLLAAGLPAFGQYSGYSPYSTQYVPSGPPTTMRAPAGSAGFEVPLERAGHYFSFKWRVRAADPITTGSAQAAGFVTASNVAGDTTMRSFLVTAYTQATSVYTPVVYTYPGTTYTYTYFTYTSVPFACFDWWLVDTTANEEFYHPGTPGPSEDLRNVAWRQLGSIPTRYFTIPEARFGHTLVAGSVAGGWSPVTSGYYTFGTYSNGTTGTQVPLHWFTGSAPLGAGDFSLADRTDGTKAPPNQTNVIGATWVHDYSVYPLASVTFYLPAAEARNLYVLHYQLPGQVPAAATLWPTTVASAFSTATVNAGSKVIAAGAAKVTGVVAVGANFWLTRNINEPSPYTSPVFTLTSALANSTAPKVWSLSPATAQVAWVSMSFGIAAGRAAQSFTVSQPSSFSPTTPALGAPTARPLLAYEDYAPDSTPNFFNYFVVTALVNPGEPFNLVAHPVGGPEEMFSLRQVWVLDGWSPLGGPAGTPPAGTPGQFNFSLKAAGPEPVGGLTLTAPSGQPYALVPSAPASITLPDLFHGDTTWTTTERTWTLALPYTGLMGDWSLSNGALDPAWALNLNVGNITDFTYDLHYRAKMRPMTLDISLSRWAFDTAPRLRLRQRDGSDFPVTAGTTTSWASLALDGTVWTNSAYSFHADTFAREGVDYWIFDEDTGEETPATSTITDFTTWFALPTPAGLTGMVSANTGAIALQWPLGFSAVEGGFTVERQLSGETTWQAIGTIPANTADAVDLLHFTEPSPVLGKVHNYRVRYTYGTGSAARRSAPSSVVSFTGWLDSDGDGLPDWWEVAWGLNPNDPADGDAISLGGDLTNLRKYLGGLNPTKADTDGDGVTDSLDKYPLDPKRSEDIPVKYYGVIDLSANLQEPFISVTPPNPLEWIAPAKGTLLTINDSGRIAFAGFVTAGPASPTPGQTVLRSVVWQNGEVLTDKTTSFGNDPADPSVHHDIVPAGINIDGEVFGNVGITRYSQNDSDTDAGIFSFTSANNYETTALADPNSMLSATMLVSPSGTIFGREGSYDETDGQHATPFFGAKRFTDYLHHSGWWPYAASPGDKLVWEVYAYAGWDEPGGVFIWDPATDTNALIPALESTIPMAINDQKQVVGDLWQYDLIQGNLGFYYADGQLHTFHDLLPAKFQKQLRSAIPYLITNADPDTNRPTVFFTAVSYQGSPNPGWVSKEFAMEMASSPPDETVIYEVVEPPGKTVKAAAANTQKTLVGTMPNGDAGGKFRCEFIESSAGAINFGFDPVIYGDRNRNTGTASQKDETVQEWWASVTKTSNDDDGDHDPRWNQSVAIDFDSANTAKNYKLVVPPAYASVLKVYPDGALTEKTTKITLEGLSGSGPSLDQVDAKVEVMPINGNDPVRVLHVKVMPLITVDLGIFRVEDTVDLAHEKKSKLDPTLPDNEKLKKALNGFFKQCGVRFLVNHDSFNYTGDNAQPFDVGQKNGVLDSSKTTDPEMMYLRAPESLFKTGKLNLVILHGLSNNGSESNKLGFCPVRPGNPNAIDGNQVFVFSTYFEHSGDPTSDFAGFKQVCAHELGHALGLSTRQNYEPVTDRTTTQYTQGHDLGLFPKRGSEYSAKPGDEYVGLMYPEATDDHRWIRHEDWFQANQVAKGFR